MNDKLNCNAELFLENQSWDDSKMRIFYNYGYGEKEYAGFTFTYKDKLVPLVGKKTEGHEEEYFHLEKQQIGFLIDFLKRLHDNML